MSFSNEPVVQIQNAIIQQEGFPILEEVNFSIQKGEFVYLLGRTGSGKSSILKTLYADIPFVEGQVNVAGFDLNKITFNKIPDLRRKLGIIFQDFELFTDRTVYENLHFVLKATGWKSKAKIKQRISDVLMRVGLESSMNKMPYQLSGGEQQRVVIARALLNEPTLLLADEPTGNLDPETAVKILDIFKGINRSGTTVLMATHNHNFVKKFPERFLLCEEKKVLDSAQTSINLDHHFSQKIF